MNFTAPAFVLLFPIVLALHWMLPPSRRWVLLLTASLGFYAVGSPQALPLLAGITLGTYAAALGIAKSKTQTAKKLWLTCAAILCIGCLWLFKYAGIFRTDVPLLLPAGISFYTFQTLSYVIDIYRGRLMPERHPGYYALFVSFFPQLVAGPIERSTALLPQLHAQERRMDSSGWLWMVRGFAKKLLLADTAAVFVDSVYASPADASGPAVLLATLLFAGQIYWDFSGYSDIAAGAAALLGVRLSRNFDHPYRADSLRDFWRRWHISLTRWFTDYVYIPLGGSRCSRSRWLLNVFLVWGLTGLWHGAAWNFVLWGLFFAVLLAAEKLWYGHGLEKTRLLKHLYMFPLLAVSFVLFNAADLPAAGQQIAALFGFGGLPASGVESLYYLRSYAVVLVIALLGATPLPVKAVQRLRDTSAGSAVLSAAEPVALVLLLALCTAYLVDGSFNPFLYFRF